MIDERARYDRKVRRLRKSARRWSVLAGVLCGVAAVLVPYAGIGVADAFWAAIAGGCIVVAGWRWADYRALIAQPAPAALDAAAVAERNRRRAETLIATIPWGREVLSGLRHQADRRRVRGSAVAMTWRRLDRASAVLGTFPVHPGGPAESAIQEAAGAEAGLRELGKRAAAVERGLSYGRSPQTLSQAHNALVTQFEDGVTAYEELVGAAAAYVAEEGRSVQPSIGRVTDATDLLRGVAAGFADLRQQT